MIANAERDAKAVTVFNLEEYLSFPGKLISIADQSIHLLCSDFVHPKTRVRVEFPNHYCVEGAVAFHRLSSEGHSLRVHFEKATASELRSESRVRLENTTAAVSLMEGGDGRHISVQVLDISRSGIGLLANEALPLGAWVKIEMSRQLLFGEIKHCSARVTEGFRIGVRTETEISRSEH